MKWIALTVVTGLLILLLGSLRATAGKVTIVQANKLVSLGDLDPECVVTPGIFVNRVIEVAHPAQESTLIAEGIS